MMPGRGQPAGSTLKEKTGKVTGQLSTIGLLFISFFLLIDFQIFSNRELVT
jgi:hypothetical protein